MSWLLPASVAALCNSLILAAVYWYLARRDRDRALYVFLASWTVYSARMATEVAIASDVQGPAILIANQVLSLLSHVLLIWATYLWFERSLPVYWVIAAVPLALWVPVGVSLQLDLSYLSAPVFLYMGLASIAVGAAFVRWSKLPGPGPAIVGWCFIVWGIHKLDYPVLRPIEWLAPWGYLLGAVLALVATVGVLVLYLERAREMLTRSQAEYRSLVEDAHSVILRWDRQGRITFANDRALRLFGYTRDELIGAPLVGTIVPPEAVDGTPLDDLPERVLADPARLQAVENENIRRDGSRVTMVWSNRPIRNGHGDVIEVISVGHDVTDLRRAERERGELEEHLRNAQRLESLGALAGGMAHDFNNVLTTILANADLVAELLEDAHPARRHIDEVTGGAEKARELVAQIHAFGRDAPSSAAPVGVTEVIDEALGLVRTVLPSRASVELRCEAGGARVSIPAVQLQQILINLATNAAHALEGGEDPRIQVAAECCRIGAEGDALQPGEYVRIAFADNGPGVPPDVVPRIFDPFFTTKPAAKGTGLGLATSRSIALAHGGDLRLAEEEPGACFHLYLPLSTADAEPQATPEAVPGGRILLVDDEETIALMSGEMLRSLGYEVTVSVDPCGALEEVRRHGGDFDLLLTDQVMPGLTGLELARQSRELEPDLPVLITTGYASNLDYDAVRQVSDADVLLKPYRRGDLRTAVAGAMRGRSGF